MPPKVYSLEEYNNIYKVLYTFSNMYKNNVKYYINKYENGSVNQVNQIVAETENSTRGLKNTEDIYIFKIQKDKYICISNFATFIYNVNNNAIFDLNSICKDHYNLKGDVYLNFFDPKRLLLYINPMLQIPRGMTSSNTYQVLPMSIKEVLQEFKYYYKAIIDSEPTYSLCDYNLYIYDLTQLAYKKKFNKKLLLPFSYFGVNDNKNIECAYLMVNIDKEKIIFPKKENIIDMFRNRFLLKNGTFIKNEYYKKYYDTPDQDILLSLAEVNKKFLDYIKNTNLVRKDDKPYLSPLSLTKLITPHLYGKSMVGAIIGSGNNILNSIVFNEDIFNIVLILTNKQDSRVFYNDINSLFSYNLYGDIKYVNDVCLLAPHFNPWLQKENIDTQSYYMNNHIIKYKSHIHPEIRPFTNVSQNIKNQIIDGELFIFNNRKTINMLEELPEHSVVDIKGISL